MSSTTKKFREFMAEPIGDKGIRDVPGIGEVLGGKLSEAGYEKVRPSFCEEEKQSASISFI